MIATDCGAALGGRCPEIIPEGTLFNEFIGEDRRSGPGGRTVYSVGCTRGNCMDAFGGVFRQSNGANSCLTAMAEDEESSCAFKCGDQGLFSDWLDYCNAATDTSAETGFTGYGV